MHFKINRKFLHNKLQLVTKAYNPSVILPILTGIKIECDNETLQLTCSDTNISILANISKNEENELKIYEKGGIILDIKYLLEIIRKVNEEYIELEIIDGSYIKIFTENIEYKINGIDIEEFPRIDFIEKGEEIKIKSSFIKEINDKTAFAIYENSIKPALSGINLIGKENKITAIATDSYRLSYKEIEAEVKNDFNLIIPVKSIKEIVSLIEKEEDINMIVNDKKLQIKIDDIIFETRLIDDVFPDVTKLLNSNFNHEIEIDVKKISSAIDRTLFIKKEGKSIINLDIKKDNVHIYTNNQEIGSYDENIPVRILKGEEIKISCNGKYLLDALKVFEVENIYLNINSNIKPIIIKSNSNDGLIQMVSPIKQ